MLRTLLVDDEKMALASLEYALSQVSVFQVVKCCTVPAEALSYVTQNHVDAVFLDIEMPQLKGTELAEKMLMTRPELQIVFTTAYTEYAIRAFEVDACDYLLKPVSIDRLKQTANRLAARFKLLQQAKSQDTAAISPPAQNTSDKIKGRKDNEIYFLDNDDIFYFSAFGRTVSAITKTGVYEVQGNLMYWEECLRHKNFVRCHKSFIVNITKVDCIAPLFKNAFSIKLTSSKDTIPVSRMYAKAVKEQLHLVGRCLRPGR